MAKRKSSRAIGYVRVSSEQQFVDGRSIEDQKTSLNDYSKRKGYRLDKTYQDAGASGAKIAGRPGLEELRERVRGGDVDVVLVRHLDRLTRNLKDLEILIQEFRAADICLETVDDEIGGKRGLSSCEDGPFMDLVTMFAGWQLERISRPTKQSQAALRALGRVDAALRFGFQKQPPADQSPLVDEEGRSYRMWEEVPNEINALKKIWKLHKAGKKFTEIADALNAESYRTKKGHSWRAQSVKDQVQHLKDPSLKNLYKSVLDPDSK